VTIGFVGPDDVVTLQAHREIAENRDGTGEP
jgi:hypothetical protein